ncbi:MAG: hypothetical protein AAF533_24505 [Acidobacteriota bacterium]
MTDNPYDAPQAQPGPPQDADAAEAIIGEELRKTSLGVIACLAYLLFWLLGSVGMGLWLLVSGTVPDALTGGAANPLAGMGRGLGLIYLGLSVFPMAFVLAVWFFLRALRRVASLHDPGAVLQALSWQRWLWLIPITLVVVTIVLLFVFMAFVIIMGVVAGGAG